MKKSYLDCRLLHVDYDKEVTSFDMLKKFKESKQYLINEFIKSFGLVNPKIETTKIVTKDQTWYYSAADAIGTTLVYFAKWPVGIDIIHIKSIPRTYIEIAKHCFTKSEYEIFAKDSSKDLYGFILTSKEALYRCYYSTHNKILKFKDWTCSFKDGALIYTYKKETFKCTRGTSEPQYIFSVCEKE